MPSDQRWTGGIANREWQAGTRAEPVTDPDALAAHVRRYLADCGKFHLDPKYHPTEDGVLKIVFHHGYAQKQAVLTAFRQLTERHAAQPS